MQPPTLSAPPASRSDYELMRAGQPYHYDEAELGLLRSDARQVCEEHGRIFDESEYGNRAMYGLFGSLGANASVSPPFTCMYGRHIYAGVQLRIGPGCMIIDAADVRIGDRVWIEPGVRIVTVLSAPDPALRAKGLEAALSITIGSDVLIGAGALLLPGATIPDGTNVAAGAVVGGGRTG